MILAEEKPCPVAEFVYTDEHGAAIARVVRMEPGRDGRHKDFLPFLATPGGFADRPGLNGITLPLYHLDEVRRAIANGHAVFFCEGEGKVDKLREALREARTAAAVTTVAGGANAPLKPEHLDELRRAERVVFLADSDAPGRIAARIRAGLLVAQAPTADVRVVDLFPDLEDGSDVADWLLDGNRPSDLRDLVDAAEPLRAEPANPEPSSPTCTLRDLREFRFERVEFFATNVVPRAELTLVNGDGGIGKTTAMLDLVARGSARRPMPCGMRHERPLRSLIVAEEDRHGLLRARLDVASADHDHIRLLESVGPEKEMLGLPSHARVLRDAIVAGGYDVVLIDALLNHLDDDVNASRPQEMRRALRPLVDVAHETGATIIAIRHLGKSAGPASSRGFGSAEARNLCRSELTIGPHPDQDEHPGLMVVALSKANLSPDRSATMAFRLTSVELNDDDGLPTTIARVDWSDAPPTISADELLEHREPADRGRIEAAADWLRARLSSGEAVRASVLQDEAVRSGHARATLYRARKQAGVRSKRQGFPAESHWSIEAVADDDAAVLL